MTRMSPSSGMNSREQNNIQTASRPVNGVVNNLAKNKRLQATQEMYKDQFQVEEPKVTQKRVRRQSWTTRNPNGWGSPQTTTLYKPNNNNNNNQNMNNNNQGGYNNNNNFNQNQKYRQNQTDTPTTSIY